MSQKPFPRKAALIILCTLTVAVVCGADGGCEPPPPKFSGAGRVETKTVEIGKEVATSDSPEQKVVTEEVKTGWTVGKCYVACHMAYFNDNKGNDQLFMYHGQPSPETFAIGIRYITHSSGETTSWHSSNTEMFYFPAGDKLSQVQFRFNGRLFKFDKITPLYCEYRFK